MAFTQSQKTRAPGGLHPAYAAYGDKAATAVLARVSRLPAQHRAKALKRALNTIDPSLWKRTQDIAQRFQKQGIPAPQALHAGLSRAMSTGLLAEVVHLGRTNTKPKKKTQVGLAAYGLGAVDPSMLQATGVIAGKLPGSSVPVAGACTPDGFFYTGTTWKRRSSTDVCSTNYTGASATVSVHNADGSITTTYPDGSVVQTPPPVTTTGQGQPGDFKGPMPVSYAFSQDDASSSDPNAASQTLTVGPFSIPMAAKQYTIHWSGLLPADWITFITAELAHDCSNCILTSMEDATPGHTLGVLRDFFGSALPAKVNKDLVGVVQPTMVSTPGSSTGKLVVKIQLPDQPIAMVSRPDNGEVWGMFMVVSPKDPSYPWDSTSNPYELQFWWRKKPSGVWDWIKRIVGAIIDTIVSAINEVGSLACDLLSSPAGQVGAVVGGAAIGATAGGKGGAQAGAQVGAAGAAIAGKQCASPLVCPPGYVSNGQQCIPVAGGGSSWLMPVALIGGGALVIALLNKRKKKATIP